MVVDSEATVRSKRNRMNRSVSPASCSPSSAALMMLPTDRRNSPIISNTDNAESAMVASPSLTMLRSRSVGVRGGVPGGDGSAAKSAEIRASSASWSSIA